MKYVTANPIANACFDNRRRHLRLIEGVVAADRRREGFRLLLYSHKPDRATKEKWGEENHSRLSGVQMSIALFKSTRIRHVRDSDKFCENIYICSLLTVTARVIFS